MNNKFVLFIIYQPITSKIIDLTYKQKLNVTHENKDNWHYLDITEIIKTITSRDKTKT